MWHHAGYPSHKWYHPYGIIQKAGAVAGGMAGRAVITLNYKT